MKTSNLNKNKMIIIVIVLISNSLKTNATNLLLNQNSTINFEFVFPVACVGLLALILLTAFLRQKSN